MPSWLATERAVRRSFELEGFHIESIAIEGRQIDLIATRQDSYNFEPETWVVEITTERVDATKGGKDYQKLDLARTHAYPGARAMLISTAGFTDDQRATLRRLNVMPLTYTEFETRKLNLRQYAVQAIAALRSRTAPDIGYDASSYIEPELSLRRDDARGEHVQAAEWIEDLLSNPVATVCALLGNLGSGKTSVLQRAVEYGCNRFLEDPDQCAVPFYIPLGRYKQHSGDIEQMMMSELRRIGHETYPAALIRHLIDHRRIILLLDGLDEVHPIQNSEDVLETVSGLLTSIGREAAAVVSCRKQFIETTGAELAYFGAYTASHLQSIQAGIARRLRGLPSTYLAEIAPFNRHRIDEYLRLRCGMTRDGVDELFKKFYGFEDMASTPVLLAMIATAVTEKLIDPSERHLFPLIALYRAYTDRWIERDVGRARLKKDHRRELSKALADHMLWNSRESEGWPYLRELLHQQPVWRDNPLSDEEAELDIRNSGFLVRDLDDRYRFIHRSIMEYFSAVAELERLRQGGRPRHFPTDGFRRFLSTLMAEAWSEGGDPFPVPSWEPTRGDGVLEQQAAMLAAATAALPVGARVALRGVGMSRTSGSMEFRQVDFSGLRWRHAGGDLRFVNCSFESTTILVENSTYPKFLNCSFHKPKKESDSPTRIRFIKPPGWTEPLIALDAQQAVLGLPGYIWDLAALCEAGAEVEIAGHRFKLEHRQLDLCSTVFSRLKSKTQRDDFLHGQSARELALLLPRLTNNGWVSEDRSRLPRMLQLTKKAREVMGRLAKDPLGAQDEFAVFQIDP